MVPGTVMGPAMVNVEIADRSTKEPTAELAKRAPWSTLEERTINILGCNINYIDVGSGEVVVFLHNGGGFWQVWWHQIKHFAETHRVLAFDWPGFGESGDIGEPLTVDSAARTLDAFTDALALHDIILIGNCIGAAVAIRYQNLHPAKVRALVPMNICPGRRIVRFRPMRTLLYNLEFAVLRKGLRRLAKFVAERPRVARRFPGVLFGGPISGDDPLFVKYSDKMREDRQTESRVRLLFSSSSFTLKNFIQNNELVRSALLMWGRDNKVAPLKRQGYFHQGVCEIERIEIIPNAGHLAMYEAPDRVTQLIEDYISKH